MTMTKPFPPQNKLLNNRIGARNSQPNKRLLTVKKLARENHNILLRIQSLTKFHNIGYILLIEFLSLHQDGPIKCPRSTPYLAIFFMGESFLEELLIFCHDLHPRVEILVVGGVLEDGLY